jgi:hypothetical protein
VADVAKHVERLHVCQQTYVPGLSGNPEIDELATVLWNVCTRLGRLNREKEWNKAGGGERQENGRGGEKQGREDGKQRGKIGLLGRLYLYGRVLAFRLLGVARPKENGRVGVVVRLMRLALKVVRDCVGELVVAHGGP